MSHQVISTAAGRIIALARTQVGVHEGRDPDGNWNNHEKYAPQVPGLTWAQNQPWCAVFVSWLALKSGYAALYPSTASVAAAHEWFRSRGQLSTTPSVGAQFILNVSEHTGFVIDFNADTIWTIEGNTNNNGSPQGNGVYALTRPRSDRRLSYGHPRLPADPKPPRVPLLPTRISRARRLLVAARPHRGPHDQAAIDQALHVLPPR